MTRTIFDDDEFDPNYQDLCSVMDDVHADLRERKSRVLEMPPSEIAEFYADRFRAAYDAVQNLLSIAENFEEEEDED